MITENSLPAIQYVNESFHPTFALNDLGQLNCFLGIEVTRTTSNILLNPRKYVFDLLRSLKRCYS